MNAIKRIVGEAIVNHSVTGIREGTDAHQDVEHLLRGVVVFGVNERVDVRQVRLRILLDQRRIAVA